MKKLISLLIIAAMTVTLFSACAKMPGEEDGGASETAADAGEDNGSDIGEGGENSDSGGSSESDSGSSSNGNSGSSSKDGSGRSGKTDGSSGSSSDSSSESTQGGSSGGKSDSGASSSDKSGTSSSDKSGSSGSGSGSGQSGYQYAQGGTSISDDYVPTYAGDPVLDIKPEDVKKYTSDGRIDEKNQKQDALTYVNAVDTSINVPTVTADTYDESKLTLPSIQIVTGDGKEITSKETYVAATLSASDGVTAHKLKNVPVDIRGRGNSTWQCFDKKPYKLKFTVKTDLFGMGAAKKWILLANALDETMMRNYLAFSLAHKLGLEFTNDYMFVNVFINGKYKGMYLLTEQIQDASTRVNINASKTGVVDCGYLVEGINSSEKTDYKTFTVPAVDGIKLGSNFRFIVEEPNDTRCTDEQCDFIRDYVTKANEAILKKDWNGITKYIDVDSFVNMFILDEVMLNQDMGYSYYMYKKAGGKLFLGPAWDFDQSAGNSSHGGSGYKGWYAGSEMVWFTALIETEQFKQLVAKRYADKKAAIREMLDETDSVINKHKYDIGMSNYVFNTFGQTDRWRTVYEIARLTTYKQQVVYLKAWLTNRMTWMENQLGVK